MIAHARKVVAEGRPIIIFPEGTRVPPQQRLPYQPGVAALYGQLKVPVVPVALNSGYFWRRRAFAKRPGTITMEILPAIAPGLPRKEFLPKLEEAVETACAQLPIPVHHDSPYEASAESEKNNQGPATASRSSD